MERIREGFHQNELFSIYLAENGGLGELVGIVKQELLAVSTPPLNDNQGVYDHHTGRAGSIYTPIPPYLYEGNPLIVGNFSMG
jgi:hypothetical protein